MKKLLKNIAIALIIGVAVGVAISFLAPAIGAAAGISEAALGGMANPIFMGLFAGSWGALGAIATPAITWISSKFSRNKDDHGHDINSSSPQQTIMESRSVDCPEHTLETTKYRDMITNRNQSTPSHTIH